jgi:GT2 family glycosyltransferase
MKEGIPIGTRIKQGRDRVIYKSKNAFIILNYNDTDNTIKLVNKISSYQKIDYIVIVDNRSTDNSFKRLEEVASNKVHVIISNQNKGYAAGNNHGIKYAIDHFAPEFLFIANPDVFFKESVITALENALKSKEEYALAGAVVNKGLNIWNLPGYHGIIEAMFLGIHTLHKCLIKKKLLHTQNLVAEAGVVEGSFFCIKASAFQKIGGFDERTFLYCEENILAFKLRQAGLKTIVLTKERYDHFHGASIKKEYKGKARCFHYFYESWVIYLKYYIKVNRFKFFIFKILYKVALMERLIFDMVKTVFIRYK